MATSATTRPNPARATARQAADRAMFAAHPDRYVAFVDTWTGDELVREVVATAEEPADFQRALAALAPTVRRRVGMTLTPAPDVIEAPAVLLG